MFNEPVHLYDTGDVTSSDANEAADVGGRWSTAGHHSDRWFSAGQKSHSPSTSIMSLLKVPL